VFPHVDDDTTTRTDIYVFASSRNFPYLKEEGRSSAHCSSVCLAMSGRVNLTVGEHAPSRKFPLHRKKEEISAMTIIRPETGARKNAD